MESWGEPWGAAKSGNFFCNLVSSCLYWQLGRATAVTSPTTKVRDWAEKREEAGGGGCFEDRFSEDRCIGRLLQVGNFVPEYASLGFAPRGVQDVSSPEHHAHIARDRRSHDLRSLLLPDVFKGMREQLGPTTGGRRTATGCAVSTGDQSPCHRHNEDFWLSAVAPSLVTCRVSHTPSGKQIAPLYPVINTSLCLQSLPPSPSHSPLAPSGPNVALLEIIPRPDTHRSVFVVSLPCGLNGAGGR